MNSTNLKSVEALVVGGPSQSTLLTSDHPVAVAIGLHQSDKYWRNWEGTVEEFVAKFFTAHDVGTKDGLCITQGPLVDTQRISNDVQHMTIVMGDVDTGESGDSIQARVEAAGLAAIMWTTHSHMKGETEIAQSVLDKFAKDNEYGDLVEAAKEYLAVKKGVVESLVQTITNVTLIHRRGGVKYIISHDPMPRWRVLCFLEKPFNFSEAGSSQKERIDEWKRRYLGFAEQLGLTIDEKCKDPARLMFTPRRPKDVPALAHDIRFVMGRLVTIEDMPIAMTAKERERAAAAEADALVSFGPAGPAAPRALGPADGTNFVTKNLKVFLAMYGKGFLAKTWLASVTEPRRIVDEAKTEFECPLDEMHSNAGDPNDKAFFAVDAEPLSEPPTGWGMYCGHATCSNHTGGDRAKYLDAACAKYGVHDALDLVEFVDPAVVAEVAARLPPTPEKREATLAQIDALAGLPNDDDRARFVAALAAVEDETRRDVLVSRYAKRVGATKKAVEAEVDKRRKAILATTTASSSSEGFAPPPLVGEEAQCAVVQSTWPFRDLQRCILGRFHAENAKSLRVFRRGDGGVIRVSKVTGQARLEEIDTPDAWTDELSHVLEFENHEGRRTAPNGEALKIIRGASDLRLPMLDRVTGTPYFGSDGVLRVDEGYHAATRTWLDPVADYLPVPQEITPAAVQDAVGLLDELLIDFGLSDAFDGAETEPLYLDEVDAQGYPRRNPRRGVSSRAHWYAMLLQPFLAGLVEGPRPFYLVTKPAAGTGASMFVSTIGGTIWTGDGLAAFNVNDIDEAALQKEVTTYLKAGSDALFLDNIEKGLNSPLLNNFATSGKWQARLLGGNEVFAQTFRGVVVLAGNNPGFDTQMARRLVPIRLDVGCERPQDRETFKYPFLEQWVRANRARLVQACHILIANWVQRGRPMWTGRKMASFEEWSAVTGGVLEAAGVPGFLATLQSYQRGTEGADDRVWEAVAAKVYEVHKGKPWGVNDVLPLVWAPWEALPTDTADLIDVGLVANNAHGARTALGARISKFMTGRTFRVADKPVRVAVLRDKRPVQYVILGEGEVPPVRKGLSDL